MRKIIALFLIVILLSGCGYTTKNIISDEYKTIYIPLLENDTYRKGKQDKAFKREVENVVSNEIIRQFLIDGSLKPVSKDNADLILEGRVTSYINQPLRYSSVDSDVVDEYRVNISVVLSLIDLNSGEVLWEDESFVQTQDYYVAGSAMSTEESSLVQAAQDLAKDVVIKVVEGW
ncbi:penicillin-binding protein activator LpoB [bacterium]|nr:penicillin-binding protein activator LpoB [bacterium]